MNRHIIFFEDANGRNCNPTTDQLPGLCVNEWRRLAIPALGLQFYDLRLARLSAVMLDCSDDDISRIRLLADRCGTTAWTRPAEEGYVRYWNSCRTLEGKQAFSDSAVVLAESLS